MSHKHLVLILDGLGETSVPSTLFRADTPCLDRLASKGDAGLLDLDGPDKNRFPSSERGILSLCGAKERCETLSRATLLTSGVEPEILLEGPQWVWLLNPARIENGSLDSYVESSSVHAFWEQFRDQSDRTGTGLIFRYSPIRRADGAIVRMAAFHPAGDEKPEPSPAPRRGERIPVEGFHGALIREATRLLPPNKEFNCVWPWGMGKWYPEVGKRPSVPSFRRWMVAASPLARSIGRILGWQVPAVPGGTGDTDTSLESKRDAVLLALRHPETSHVFCHIEGFDLASHRRNPDEKRVFLEHFDRVFGPALIRALEEEETDNLWITCDHLSSPVTGDHETGPVPFLHVPGILQQRSRAVSTPGRFNESSAFSGRRLSLREWTESLQL
ncbi:MAG: alkaline phosphatase family protein [Leptospirales bacterium]